MHLTKTGPYTNLIEFRLNTPIIYGINVILCIQFAAQLKQTDSIRASKSTKRCLKYCINFLPTQEILPINAKSGEYLYVVNFIIIIQYTALN